MAPSNSFARAKENLELTLLNGAQSQGMRQFQASLMFQKGEGQLRRSPTLSESAVNASVTTVRDIDIITKTQKCFETANCSTVPVLLLLDCVCTRLELKIVYTIHTLVSLPSSFTTSLIEYPTYRYKGRWQVHRRHCRKSLQYSRIGLALLCKLI